MSNKECDIVQDLLPLYYDNACSEESRRFVEKHLPGCNDCQKMYNELKENNVDEVLAKESKGILERHAKIERNAAYKAGVVIAAILLLPIVITFIVQLATGMGLGVFSVVTASMLLVAALTVVPLMSTNNRLLKCILAGVTSLMLILFFVDRMNGGGNFLLWAIPTVFGISIVLFPIVICLVKLPPVLSDKKALITMTWDTLWLFLTMFTVYYHSGFTGMRDGYTVAVVLMLGVWLEIGRAHV